MFKKLTVPGGHQNVARSRDADFASLLLEELRTAQELTQRLECLEHARAQRRRVRPVAGTFRAELVESLRKQIAEDAYLSDDRLAVALARLIETEIRNPSPGEPRKAAG